MTEAPYKVPNSVNFKRMRKGAQVVSTTLDTKSGSATKLLELVRKCRGIEGFINHRLYHIHRSSQNYYFMKDVNQILSDDRTPSAIKFKDICQDMQVEELLIRFYRHKEYIPKMVKLCEYYKFHKEIPRIFAKDAYDNFFDYHDRKRKVEYVVITKKLKEEAGEDVNAELEVNLKQVRDKKYEPLLAGLEAHVPSHYKQPKNTKEPESTKSLANDSMSSLQEQISRIFRNNDLSMSELRMNTIPDDEKTEAFSRFLGSSVDGLQEEVTKFVPTLKEFNFKRPKQKLVLNKSKPAKNGEIIEKEIKIDSHKPSLTSDVVESLKKISLPGTLTQKSSFISKKRGSIVKETGIQDMRSNGDAKMPTSVTVRGAIQLQASSSGVKRGVAKALTREPSLKSATRNKSSSSVRRGLTFNRGKPEDDVKVISLKREYTDFRITKNMIEGENSPGRPSEIYGLAKDSIVQIKRNPSQQSIGYLNINEGRDRSIKREGSVKSFKQSDRGLPATMKYTINEGSQPVTTKDYTRTTTRAGTKMTNSKLSSPATHAPNLDNLSNIGGAFNFKVNIDRLLKSSGIMEYKSGLYEGSQNNGSATVRGNHQVGGIVSNPQGPGSKHKYTKSGPEVLNYGGGSSTSNLRSFRAQGFGSIGRSDSGVRPVNSLQGMSRSAVKQHTLKFGIGDDMITGSGSTFRGNPLGSNLSTARESVFHKKGSMSLAQNKPYLADNNVFGNKAIKLVKKASNSKQTSKR